MRLFSRTILFMALLISLIPVSAQSGIASLLDLVNQARIAQGIPPLAPSSVLTSVAQAHSNDMAKTQTLSHTGSDKSEFWERMQNGGYALTTGAENILVRADVDAAAAFEQWKASPSHLANMLNPDYHEIGIAYTQAFNGSYYYTMLLGARTDSKPQPLVSATPTSPASSTPTATPNGSGNATAAPTRAVATSQPSLTATPIPPSATSTAESIQITTIAQSPDATPTATLQATRAINDASTPTVIPTTSDLSDSPPQILLTYSEDSLVLINIAPEPMDISELIFTSENGEFEARRWREFGAQALNALLPGDCLQIWTTETRTLPEQPETCTFRQAWLAVGPTGQFWRDAESFTVENNSQIVAECPIAAGTCDFALTKESVAVTETIPSVAPDIQLIVEQNGVTLINVSGEALNLSSLTFVGEAHTFDALRWDTPSLSRPLHQFPANDCVQVWTFGDSSDPLTPTECGLRHGWILVPPSEQFWTEAGSFIVLNNNISIGTCSTANRVCDLSLP